MFEFYSEGKLQYLLRFPEGFDREKRYPLIIYLHGAGSRRTSLEHLSTHTLFRVEEASKDRDFVIAAPLCTAETWHSLWEHLERFVETVAALPFVDSRRVYLVGASMGGYATWQLSMTMPEKIAAIVPICGGGMYWNAGRLKDVPVWAFHGALDKTVLPEESLKMVTAVNSKGGNAKLTVYPHNSHDAWTDTFSDPDLYKWLLQHTKA